jgi:uncharacterized protein (TIGR00730 family)
VVETMHERKALMAGLSDAFIALPGGLGTLDETFEMLTWTQLGYHRKPSALLDVDGYFERLVAFSMLIFEHDPGAALDRLSAAQLPNVSKWMDRTVS